MTQTTVFIAVTLLATGAMAGAASSEARTGTGQRPSWSTAQTPATPPTPQVKPTPPTPPAPPPPPPAPRERHGDRRSRANEQEATETRTFKFTPGTVLSVSNVSGGISIAAGGGDEVRVHVVRRAYGPTAQEAQRQLEATSVEMEQRGSRIDIRTTPRGSRHSAEVDYTITAPASLSVDVRSISGDVTVRGLSGEARIESVSGDIQGRDLTFLSAAKTVSGSVDLAGCSAGGEVEANSVSGDVIVQRLKAKGCALGTVSGDVELRQSACDRVEMRAVSGSLTFASPLGAGGRYEFKTHSGDVRLALDGKVGFELDARSFSGTLRSDLALSSRREDHESRLQGMFGDGSAQISVTTFSGDVIVGKQ